MGGKIQRKGPFEHHLELKKSRDLRNRFAEKISKVRKLGMYGWKDQQKGHIEGWLYIMHASLHQGSLEYALSRRDASQGRLYISLKFDPMRFELAANTFIFCLGALLLQMEKSVIFSRKDQKWLKRYETAKSLFELYVNSSPTSSAPLIINYIKRLIDPPI